MMKANFETAIKVGRPVARQAAEAGARYIVSECPLAGLHIIQGMERHAGADAEMVKAVPETVPHPIQILARAYEQG